MKTKSILVTVMLGTGLLYSGSAIAQTAASTTTADRADAPVIAGPVIMADRVGSGANYPDKPHGVPSELHRKVVQLYKRIHNAYPDASRKRIFLKIAQELDIAPRRLWNIYHHPHEPGTRPVVTDAKRIDAARDVRPVDRRTRDRAQDRTRDRARDRTRDRTRDRRADRPRDRVRRDRPARTRPQRDG